ncbi:hypothetical protein JWG45_09930 [Leptospira sp. 201903070]|uniref:Uncharacterized protein n=1 Tax=Leptospira ainlahdjerensis TaxID=2810033 RepID=A0ABS2UAS8_9LEPT|nr:hypothetical protein [Leptospira ainlahdjerensis]MBM9577470.1 hypothetical protein [Leptospira ainlahdjerensis]
MNLTKKQKILKLIRADKNIFEDCWKEVPEHMIRKLKADELADYMSRHILPVIERRNVRTSYLHKALSKKEIAVA